MRLRLSLRGAAALLEEADIDAATLVVEADGEETLKNLPVPIPESVPLEVRPGEDRRFTFSATRNVDGQVREVYSGRAVADVAPGRDIPISLTIYPVGFLRGRLYRSDSDPSQFLSNGTISLTAQDPYDDQNATLELAVDEGWFSGPVIADTYTLSATIPFEGRDYQIPAEYSVEVEAGERPDVVVPMYWPEEKCHAYQPEEVLAAAPVCLKLAVIVSGLAGDKVVVAHPESNELLTLTDDGEQAFADGIVEVALVYIVELPEAPDQNCTVAPQLATDADGTLVASIVCTTYYTVELTVVGTAEEGVTLSVGGNDGNYTDGDYDVGGVADPDTAVGLSDAAVARGCELVVQAIAAGSNTINAAVTCVPPVVEVPDPPPTTYPVRVTTSGLSGSLTLTINDAYTATIDANGTQLLEVNASSPPISAALSGGPSNQACSVGVSAGLEGDPLAYPVTITCVYVMRTITVSATGLAGGASVSVRNGSESSAAVTSASPASFSVVQDTAYNITIDAQPAGYDPYCVVNSGVGVAKADANVTVRCTPQVQCATNFGEACHKWNNYRATDGQACDNPQRYSDCLHVAERFQVTLTDVASCDDISGSDALGALEWDCNVTGAGQAMVYSTGLKDSARLADLIDTNALTWNTNSLNISGPGSTTRQTWAWGWWDNNISAVALNENAIPVSPAAGSIAVVTQATYGDTIVVEDDNVTLLVPDTMAYASDVDPLVRIGAFEVAFNGSPIYATWIEGTMTPQTEGMALQVNSTRLTVLRNVTVTGGIAGVQLTNATAAGLLQNVELQSAGPRVGSGVRLQSASGYVIDAVSARGYETGFAIEDPSSANTLQQVRALQCATGIQVSASNNQVVGSILAANTVGLLIDNSADRVMANDLMVFNSGDASWGSGVEIIGARNTVIANLTVVNQTSYGVLISNAPSTVILNATVANTLEATGAGVGVYGSNNVYLLNVAAVNNARGVYIDGGTVTLSRLASFRNDINIALANTPVVDPYGGLVVGGGGVDCNGTSTRLLQGATSGPCTVDFVDSTTDQTTPAAAAESFVGKVSEDSTNAEEGPDGRATGQKALGDLVKFDSGYRTWMVDPKNTAFPDESHRGAYELDANTTVQIFDWRLLVSDTTLRKFPLTLQGVVPLAMFWEPGLDENRSSATCAEGFPGSTYDMERDVCRSTFLPVGLDYSDGGTGTGFLCEPTDTCLLTENIGSYQGEEGLVSMGSGTDSSGSTYNFTTYNTNGVQ